VAPYGGAPEGETLGSGDGWVINGTKCYVIDGHVADLLLVAARPTWASRSSLCRLTLRA
jgi:alkylation response protein AidB-like acyl-CoA dehydrogenase